jgi:hypothetical protein
MPPLAELQSRMARALLEDPRALPIDVFAHGPTPISAALKVHRDTVLGGFSKALSIGFPTVAVLVGEAFFDQAAAAFALAHPPCDPSLDRFGDAFPGFIAAYAPAEALAYLPDVARLDQAIERAARAPLLSRLIPIDAAIALRLPVSLATLRLDWPADLIVDAIQAGGEDALAAIELERAPAWMAVWRQGEGAGLRRLSGPAGLFLQALLAGSSANDAFASAGADAPPEQALLAIQAEVFAAPSTAVVPTLPEEPQS